MGIESAPTVKNKTEKKLEFMAKQREVLTASKDRLRSALDGDLNGYREAYAKIANLQIDSHKSAIEDMQNDSNIPDTDKQNGIKALEEGLASVESFLADEISDDAKMQELMEADKQRLNDGEGVNPIGRAGGFLGGSNRILEHTRISKADNLDAFYDEYYTKHVAELNRTEALEKK